MGHSSELLKMLHHLGLQEVGSPQTGDHRGTNGPKKVSGYCQPAMLAILLAAYWLPPLPPYLSEYYLARHMWWCVGSLLDTGARELMIHNTCPWSPCMNLRNLQFFHHLEDAITLYLMYRSISMNESYNRKLIQFQCWCSVCWPSCGPKGEALYSTHVLMLPYQVLQVYKIFYTEVQTGVIISVYIKQIIFRR